MTTRIILLLGFSFVTLHAADSSPEDLLRQGLFEEEANRDLDKATASYQAVIATHDRQRATAATATFRLGEIARKKNDKEAAAAAFRSVIERFPEQAELARLSRENLTALGMAPAGGTSDSALTNDPEDAEIARLKALARNGPDFINEADTDGWRPIHHAASKGWTRAISYLLENHVDPNSRTKAEQLTPLQLASIRGYLASVRALLAAKADVDTTLDIERCPEGVLPVAHQNAKDAKGKWTALDLAILFDRREVARALIEAGTDTKRMELNVFRSSEIFTPLDLAIDLQSNDLAQALIDAGAPLAPMGIKDPSPLALAIRKNPGMVAPLLKAGADPKQPYSDERTTPLQGAAEFDRIESAKLLINAGADVNAKDANGITPLHRVKSPEMVELLISKGASPNAKNTAGLTPLDVIAARPDSLAPGITALLKHGASVDEPLALLRRTSENNLSFVRNQIVYPREKHQDSIILSVDGDPHFNKEPRPDREKVMPPVAGIPSPPSADFLILETRPSPDSPPPSLAEALCEAFRKSDYPQSIRILRRDSGEALKIIREWKPTEGVSMPTDWPALEWGDIVEVRINGSFSGGTEPPAISNLSKQIPARSVTYSMCGLEIPKTIPGDGTYWLSRNSNQSLPELPNTQYLVNLSRFTIHRKGIAEPILLDFSKTTGHRFRLIDGDTVELSLDVADFYRESAARKENKARGLFGKENSHCYTYGEGSTDNGGRFLKILAGIPITPPIDYHRIVILRQAENWKPEIVDVKAWLDSLPPSEQWKKDTLLTTATKLQAGDLVILVEDTAKDAEKSANVIREKIRQVEPVLSGAVGSLYLPGSDIRRPRIIRIEPALRKKD